MEKEDQLCQKLRTSGNKNQKCLKREAIHDLKISTDFDTCNKHTWHLQQQINVILRELDQHTTWSSYQKLKWKHRRFKPCSCTIGGQVQTWVRDIQIYDFRCFISFSLVSKMGLSFIKLSSNICTVDLCCSISVHLFYWCSRVALFDWEFNIFLIMPHKQQVGGASAPELCAWDDHIRDIFYDVTAM